MELTHVPTRHVVWTNPEANSPQTPSNLCHSQMVFCLIPHQRLNAKTDIISVCYFLVTLHHMYTLLCLFVEYHDHQAWLASPEIWHWSLCIIWMNPERETVIDYQNWDIRHIKLYTCQSCVTDKAIPADHYHSAGSCNTHKRLSTSNDFNRSAKNQCPHEGFIFTKMKNQWFRKHIRVYLKVFKS